MRKYDEVELVVTQVGRPDDGTDPTGFYHVEFFVPLKQPKDWPAVKKQDRFVLLVRQPSRPHQGRADRGDERRIETGPDRRRLDILAEHSRQRDGSLVRREGRKLRQDLRTRSRRSWSDWPTKPRKSCRQIEGVQDVGVYHIKGQTNLEFPIDRAKCARWNVNVADVQNVLQTAVGGKAVQPDDRRRKNVRHRPALARATPRQTQSEILNIPVDVTSNNVTGSSVAESAVDATDRIASPG